MRLAALAAAAIVATTSAQACDHAIDLSNWKSCAIGPLSENGGEADWAVLPAWTRNPAIRRYFDDDPRALALHGLCNAKYRRVVLCLVGWQDSSDKGACWYLICSGAPVQR